MDAVQLAHAGDPETSRIAAERISDKALVFDAIAQIITSSLWPLTAEEISAIYFRNRDAETWPVIDPYSVRRRLSEMHVSGQVRPVGEGTSSSGRPAKTWELVR